MSGGRRTVLVFVVALVFVIVGIVFKYAADRLIGLYICHTIAGGLILMAILDRSFPPLPSGDGSGEAPGSGAGDGSGAVSGERLQGRFLNRLLGESWTSSADALSRCFLLEGTLASQLRSHAESARGGGPQDRLHKLASHHEGAAARLREKLQQLGAEVPEARPGEAASGNNWSRVKLEIEALRDLHVAYSEAAVNIDRQDVGELLESLNARAQSDEGELLDLIARADPYAAR